MSEERDEGIRGFIDQIKQKQADKAAAARQTESERQTVTAKADRYRGFAYEIVGIADAAMHTVWREDLREILGRADQPIRTSYPGMAAAPDITMPFGCDLVLQKTNDFPEDRLIRIQVAFSPQESNINLQAIYQTGTVHRTGTTEGVYSELDVNIDEFAASEQDIKAWVARAVDDGAEKYLKELAGDD